MWRNEKNRYTYKLAKRWVGLFLAKGQSAVALSAELNFFDILLKDLLTHFNVAHL